MKTIKKITWLDLAAATLIIGIILSLILMFFFYQEELRLEKELEQVRQSF
ncbi:hypothetical protein [Psychroflexus salis]|uniref:Uncharacterized protein n=1 Tax=Psychroflexus salis TaxID=1526574 RepID=A0A917A2L0_9FLAO|nr:hypothetical protein [Psychroflexus salis]GGE23253.1 hypothetical protein GCM10010831_25150 [Psychroflexus salis]